MEELLVDGEVPVVTLFLSLNERLEKTKARELIQQYIYQEKVMPSLWPTKEPPLDQEDRKLLAYTETDRAVDATQYGRSPVFGGL